MVTFQIIPQYKYVKLVLSHIPISLVCKDVMISEVLHVQGLAHGGACLTFIKSIRG